MGFRAAREKAGLSQAETARQLNVSRSAVCIWEAGRSNPSIENLKAAAALFRCTVDELLREDEK